MAINVILGGALLLAASLCPAQTAALPTPQIYPNELVGTYAPHTVRYKLPQAEIAEVGAVAVSHGWTLSSGAEDSSGTVVNGPVTLSFTYSGGMMTIVITQAPWYIDEGMIFGEILSWFYTPVPYCGAPCPTYKH